MHFCSPRVSAPARGRCGGALLLAVLITGSCNHGLTQGRPQAPAHYREGFLLVQIRAGRSEPLAAFHASHGCEVVRSFNRIPGLQVIRLPKGRGVPELVAAYNSSGLFEFAEPDFIGQIFTSPNDGLYLNGSQWGLHNDGSNGGTPHADIDAPEGWDLLSS